MQRLRLFTALFVVPVAVSLVGALGCSGDKDGGDKGAPPNTSKPGGTPSAGGLTAVEAKGTATIKGTVTYDGTPPSPGSITGRDDFKKSDSKDHCLKGDTHTQTWKVGANGGVANVFVWVKPPAGKYFPVPDAKVWQNAGWPGTTKDNPDVTIDQPFCQFEPHCLLYFPEDAKGKKSSQKFIIKNSAPISHNTNWKGGNENPGDNQILAPAKTLTVELLPSGAPVTFHCNIHGWMDGHCWVLNHPYAAVTDKDGHFEIKNVPAGVELDLIGWHEGANSNADSTNLHFVLPAGQGARKGQNIGPLKDGDTKQQDFKVKE